jgi:hypothetical protein
MRVRRNAVQAVRPVTKFTVLLNSFLTFVIVLSMTEMANFDRDLRLSSAC